MKTIRILFVCFLIVGFVASITAAPAKGMGKILGSKKIIAKAKAEAIQIPPLPAGMEDGIVRNADGTKKYVLLVESGFNPSDLQNANGKCDWYWQEAGIAIARSASESFIKDAEGNPNLNVISVAPAVLVMDDNSFPKKDSQNAAATSSTGLSSTSSDLHDAYLSGYQWPLQAIGAVRYDDPQHPNKPVWKLGNYTGKGVTIGVMDSGMPAMIDISNGQKRLNQDYVWYKPETGGIVPIFNSQTELDSYYYQYGQDEGMDKSCAIVLPPDPYGNPSILGGFDVDGHATLVDSPISAVYKPKVVDWTIRGIAPGVRLISYRTRINLAYQNFQDPTLLLEGCYRSIQDGCQIVQIAFSVLVSRNYDLFPLFFGYELKFRQAMMQAFKTLAKHNILITCPAANWGFSANDLLTSASITPTIKAPFFMLPQLFARNALMVSGTAPRDYDPNASNLSIYDPAQGKGIANNLDRPGVFDSANPEVPGLMVPGTTCYGQPIDVAAPSGSLVSTPNGYICPVIMANSISNIGQHVMASGTSLSAPTVAALAALVIEAYKEAHGSAPTVARLKEIILKSSDDLVGPATDQGYIWTKGSPSSSGNVMIDIMMGLKDAWNLTTIQADKPGEDDFYGAGRVNALRAIEMAKK